MALRAALLSPAAPPSVGGNAVTVGRVARVLRGQGVDLQVWDLSATPPDAVAREVAAYGPTLIHGFHALRAGPLALDLADRADVPLVITITGTDANHHLFEPETAATVRRVLEGAAAITVFHESIAARLTGAVPGLAPRIALVPQSVLFEDDPEPLSPRRATGPLILFPTGIRRIKRPRLPLAALDAVAARHPGLELRYVGPIIEADEGQALREALSARPWARYAGEVPHPRMRRLIETSDVVLNCSVSEGGMANSVLEALAAGRAVLASDIEGNRSLVEDGVTGLLFSSAQALAVQAERLLRDPALRRRLGEAGRERVTARFTAAREGDGYRAVYERVAAACLARERGRAGPTS
jgi:glycosyltransferase involved in cell wall biosynthesis